MKYLLLIIIGLSIFGCGSSDPLKDYPNSKDYVEPYDRKLVEQYFLERDSIKINAPKTLEFTKNVATSYDVSVNVNFLRGTDRYDLQGVNFPNWLELEKQDKEGHWKIQGEVPASFKAGPDGTYQVRLLLKMDLRSDGERRRVEFYDKEKVIILKILGGE